MTDLPLMEPSTGQSPESPPARRPRRLGLIIGILAGIVVLLVIVGAVTWHFVSQDSISLKPPAAAAGLTRDDSDNARTAADYLRDAVAAKIGLVDSVGAVYGDPADKDRDVLLFGGTRLMINPGNDLDQAFAALLNDNSGAVTGLRDVPAGPLGGVMKCGTSTGDGGSMVTCGWADRGSLVLALFPGRTVDEAAGLLRTLRGAIEQVH